MFSRLSTETEKENRISTGKDNCEPEKCDMWKAELTGHVGLNSMRSIRSDEGEAFAVKKRKSWSRKLITGINSPLTFQNSLAVLIE